MGLQHRISQLRASKEIVLLHIQKMATENTFLTSAHSRVLEGLQILLVEDEPDIGDLLTFILEDAGADVIGVMTAHEAFDVLEHTQPDLLLCNLRLPDESGYFLIKKVRKSEQGHTRLLPAIAVTSYTRETSEALALEAGFHHYMSKPIDPQELLKTIIDLTTKEQ